MFKIIAALGIYLMGILADQTTIPESSTEDPSTNQIALFKMTDYEY
jgi:hypothetical protein